MLRPNRCLEEIIKCFEPVKLYIFKSLETNQIISNDNPQSNHSSKISETQLEKPPSDISPVEHVENTSNVDLRLSNSHPEVLSKPGSSRDTPTRRSACQSVNRLTPSQLAKEVSCPVCNTSMRDTLINVHLDFCLNKNKPAKRKPLPKLIYTLMKDLELKKRLRDLGLNALGDRSTLINRHKKYTILYNAECDAAQPRTVDELRAQFEEEEAESRRLARDAAARIKPTDIESIQRENTLYLEKNKQSYDRLIQDIRQRQSVKIEHDERQDPVKVEEKAKSDDEVTVLDVPPKIYETIALSDSEESGSEQEPRPCCPVSSGSSSSSSTGCSISDPASSTDSNSNDSSSTSVDSAAPPRASSPSYSPLTSNVPSNPSKKRSKSPLEQACERRMSLRRKL